jgi:predicted aminopeptidase
MKRLLTLFSILGLFTACSNLSYYSQAIGGHLSLLMKRHDIQELVQDPKLSQKLRERLALSQQVIAFARDKMALPDNGSYRHFVKVDGPYVVWNVIAAPRYSLKPKQWCYPIAGCANYRGYYHKSAAEAYAAELRRQGLDVAVAGASAYSTLGWFSDPLLSTMLYRDKGQFVEVIIHELAHQRFYLPGNSQLNESFAEVVAVEGVKRWFASRGDEAAFAKFLKDRDYERGFNQLLLQTRARLEALYDSGLSEAEMAEGKRTIFQQLQQNYQKYKEKNGGDDRYDKWMSQHLNNAHLAMVATYHDLEPLFTRMLEQSGGDMEAFYTRVEAYAEGLEKNTAE